MAKQLTFTFKDATFLADLAKVDRSKIYGKSEVVTTTPDGEVCVSANILPELSPKTAHDKMERIAKELGFSLVYKEGKARYEYNDEIGDYICYPDEPRPRERYSSFYYCSYLSDR